MLMASSGMCLSCAQSMLIPLTLMSSQRGHEYPDPRRCCDQEGHQCLQQEDLGEACAARDKVTATLQRAP